jgi:hypothetical protein
VCLPSHHHRTQKALRLLRHQLSSLPLHNYAAGTPCQQCSAPRCKNPRFDMRTWYGWLALPSQSSQGGRASCCAIGMTLTPFRDFGELPRLPRLPPLVIAIGRWGRDRLGAPIPDRARVRQMDPHTSAETHRQYLSRPVSCIVFHLAPAKP